MSKALKSSTPVIISGILLKLALSSAVDDFIQISTSSCEVCLQDSKLGMLFH